MVQACSRVIEHHKSHSPLRIHCPLGVLPLAIHLNVQFYNYYSFLQKQTKAARHLKHIPLHILSLYKLKKYFWLIDDYSSTILFFVVLNLGSRNTKKCNVIWPKIIDMALLMSWKNSTIHNHWMNSHLQPYQVETSFWHQIQLFPIVKYQHSTKQASTWQTFYLMEP